MAQPSSPPPAPVAVRLTRRALYEAKTLVARHPAVAMPVLRLRGHGMIVDRNTDIVIEGYARSANSFAVAAFERVNGGRSRIRVAHHTHAPAQVIAAVRSGVPALVLIREPVDAVLGHVVHKPYLGVAQALRGWVRFYDVLLPYIDHFVVGAFDDVTRDFGSVVRRVNRRFGTSFVEFEHTAESQQDMFDELEAYWKGEVGTGPVLEQVVGRPSSVREAWKADLRPAFDAARLARWRARASRLWETYLAEAGR